jgi:hypothetical protein
VLAHRALWAVDACCTRQCICIRRSVACFAGVWLTFRVIFRFACIHVCLHVCVFACVCVQEAVWNAFPGVLDPAELHCEGFLWHLLTVDLRNATLTRFKRLIGIMLQDGVGCTTPFTVASVGNDALPR